MKKMLGQIITTTILSFALTNQSTFAMEQTEKQSSKRLFGMEIDLREIYTDIANQIKHALENNRIKEERRKKLLQLNSLKKEFEKLSKMPTDQQTTTSAKLDFLRESAEKYEKQLQEIDQCLLETQQIYTNLMYELGKVVVEELNKKREQENLIQSTTINEEDHRNAMEKESDPLVAKLMDGAVIAIKKHPELLNNIKQAEQAQETVASIEESH